MKAKAATARTKAQNESVIGKGRGKAVLSSNSAGQQGREVLYDLLRHIFACLTMCVETCSGRPDSRRRG